MAKSTKITSISTAPVAEPFKAVPTASGMRIVTIPGIKTEKVTCLVVGTAPLICHKFSQKVIGQLLAKHKGEAKQAREKKDPEANFEAARYRLLDGSDGVPAGGVKGCIVAANDKDSGLAKTTAKGVFRVSADCVATNLIRIITPTPPRMREDVTRTTTGVVNITHRPEYWPWAMLLNVEFLPGYVSIAQTLQAIEMAGFRIGLCEWRPSSKMSTTGTYGTFRLATEEEIVAFDEGRLFGGEGVRAAA